MATFDDDDDLEYLAIGKCSKALSVLDNESRIRVIRYMLDKFGLIEQNSFIPKQAAHTKTAYHHDKLAIEDRQQEVVNPPSNNFVKDKPSIKDILIKNYAKTEPDLALVIAYYESNFGNDSFERHRFVEVYKENNLMNDQRRKNLTSVIRGLIRKSYIKTITDNTFSVLTEGIKQAEAVIAGNSTSVSKNKGKKK